jgi:hypothetical protein
MHLTRAALLLLVLAAPVAWAFPERPPIADNKTPNFRFYPSATPLDRIPLYALSAAAPEALKALETEIDRLSTYARSLDSGAERRAFETRIYLLEKRLHPLLQDFDAPAWESLRSDVKSEWESILAALAPEAPSVASVTEPTS